MGSGDEQNPGERKTPPPTPKPTPLLQANGNEELSSIEKSSRSASRLNSARRQRTNASATTLSRPAHQNHSLYSDDNRDEWTIKNRVRWSALITIVTSLTVGLVLALGHHFMNSYLHGKPVDDVSVSQSWIFRFGTGFAFLVKTAFAITVGVSYVQYQWLQFQYHSFRLDEIDSLTDILQNALRFFYTLVFLRQPILLFMAVVAWTIPAAAVVTPGSLTIQPAVNSAVINRHVPQPDFSSEIPFDYEWGTIESLVTSPLIYKLAYISAAAGEPVPIRATYQNESYKLSFIGPAVRCTPATEETVMNLNLETDYSLFLSWVPSYDGHRNYETTLDVVSTGAPRIFVATRRHSGTLVAHEEHLFHLANITDFHLANVTECQLYNATYDVDFHFQYPNQTRQVSISNWHNPVLLSSLEYTKEEAELTEATVYLAIMQAFGKVLVGHAATTGIPHRPLPVYTSWEIININWFEAAAVHSGLESLFQNITLSLLSESALTKPLSETDPVPVAVTTYPNTYVYAAWELLTAYSVAFLFALMCAILGLYALLVNHASYSNIFSSFLRAASDLDCSSDGAYPLPASLAKTTIVMGKKNAQRK